MQRIAAKYGGLILTNSPARRKLAVRCVNSDKGQRGGDHLLGRLYTYKGEKWQIFKR